MEIQSLKCLECMAPISTDIEGKEYIYCAHCGAKLIFNRGNKREYTININENVIRTTNQNINQNIINRTVDETKVERAKAVANIFNSIKTIVLAAIIGFLLLLIIWQVSIRI